MANSKPEQDRTTTAVARAHQVIKECQRESVDKTVFGAPAGKKQIAKQLAAMLPSHKAYVEPFIGSAAVLFAKEPAEVEVINDIDREIADAYRTLKRLTAAELERLKRRSWVGDEQTYKRLFDAKPTDSISKLYRFLYLAHFSYGSMRGRGFSPSDAGRRSNTITRVERFAPRLRKVRVYDGDYEKVVRKYDSKDTVFFFDPPYPGYDVKIGESSFDEERFFELLKTLKGKFLITYGVRGRFPQMVKESKYWTKRLRTRRAIRQMRGVGGSKVLTQLLVANYEPTRKSLGDDFILEDWDGEVHAEDGFAKTGELVKGLDPHDERYVLGIVLEPEVVDAQGDIYSAEEIRTAAHRFMEEFGGLGLMHRLRVNGEVKVLESYLAPTDFTMGELTVRQGTWLLAVRVLSDELWERVKSGELSGFSIGGSARRQVEPVVPDEPTSPSGSAPEKEVE